MVLITASRTMSQTSVHSSLGTLSELIIKNRWQEYTEKRYKKDFHDPDNHDGVITHLESDILECEVKWALGSIITNKVSGGDGIPVELFQILKDDAVKVLHSICQQIWKFSSSHRTGKGQFSFQSQRKTISKNVQTESENDISQLLPTLCDSMDCSPPSSSIHGIFQARVLEWVAISFFKGSP